MTSTAATRKAYMVPSMLWERMKKTVKEQADEIENLKKNTTNQSGGGVAGVGVNGKIDTDALLHAMAVNLSLQQHPNAEFVKRADALLKQALVDPNLSSSERIRLINSYADAYQYQRGKVNETKQVPSPVPAPAPAPAPAPVPATGDIQTPAPQPIPTPGTSGVVSFDTPRIKRKLEPELDEDNGGSPLSPKQKTRRKHLMASYSKLSKSEMETKMKELNKGISTIKKKNLRDARVKADLQTLTRGRNAHVMS